jgi:hypothetical protein
MSNTKQTSAGPFQRLLFLAALLSLPMAAGAREGDGEGADRHAKGAWLSGDFHQHTLYTDGSTPFDFVMSKNAEFGLDWWANSEHGGGRNRDGNGAYWDDASVYPVNPILGDLAASGGHQVMWRWQSLRDFVFGDVQVARETYPDKAILSGLEWNVPGHEHCSTGIVARDPSALSAFEYTFDQSDNDTSRTGEVTPYGTLEKRNGRTYPGAVGKSYPERHQDAVAACAWMQAQYERGLIENGWIVFAHVERDGAWSAEDGGGYNVEHFRDFNDAGPDVCFGFEGAPGHQVNDNRGFGNTVTCDAAGACTSKDFGGTYGGVGYYTARVGGLWDALLGEGRRFFNFASSDYHRHHTAGGDDFYPGEYQRDWVFVKGARPEGRASANAIADALRSGTSFFVQGDLVDRLVFTARHGEREAAMGEALELPGRGRKQVELRIRFRTPERNAAGGAPTVDHVDLVAGAIGGRIPSDDPAYTDPTNPTAKVIASFTASDWETDEDGFATIVHRVEVDGSTYFRLRGTNLPCGTPNETGPAAPLPSADHCSPLPDALAYPNDAGKAFADLWFYSNPIFVHAD